MTEALELALTLREGVVEVAIFTDHGTYGGIFVWTSLEPDLVNRFDHLLDPDAVDE